MIRKSDIQWWLLEAKKDPAAVPGIIEALAARLVELDEENERLRDELIRLQRGSSPAAPDRAELAELQRKVDSLHTILKGQASTETAIILISDQVQTVRLPLSQVRLRLRGQELALTRSAVLSLSAMLLARPQDDLLLLTNMGRLLDLPLHKIPFQVEEQGWPPAEDRSVLPEGEQVTAAVAVAQPPRFWTVVTRRGYVRQVLRVHADKQVGEVLFEGPFRGDTPVAMVDGDRGDLFLISRWGKAIRFPQRAIGLKGVVAMDLEPDDQVVAALTLDSDIEVLIVTAAGYAVRREMANFRAQTRTGGAGKALVQAYDVLGAFHYAERGKLLFLTYSGRLAAVKTAGIPTMGRLGKGHLVHDLSKDTAVAVTFVPGALL
jgi:DNA gyrase subunit A